MKLVEQIQEYCRDRNAKCPHCGKKISMKQRTVFLLRGTAHYINCEHCVYSIRIPDFLYLFY